MLQSSKLQLQYIYGRIFPLDSFRRFVADQLLQTSYYFGYYGGLTLIITTAISSILYLLGSTAEKYLGPVIKNSDHYIISGIIGGIIVAIILGSVIGFLYLFMMVLHSEDYLPWVKSRQEQGTDAIVWIYFLLRIGYVTAAILTFAIYAVLSVKGFKLVFGTPRACPPQSQLKIGETRSPCIEQDFPDFGIFFISLFMQVGLYIIIYLLYQGLSLSCRNAYAKHLQRANSAASKCDDAEVGEVHIALK